MTEVIEQIGIKEKEIETIQIPKQFRKQNGLIKYGR